MTDQEPTSSDADPIKGDVVSGPVEESDESEPADPSEAKKWWESQTKLDFLPEEMREELDKLVTKGASPAFARRMMTERFEKKSSLVKASVSSYKRYFHQNRERLAKESELKKELVEANREQIQAAGSTLQTLVDPNQPLENKKQALAYLFSKCAERLKLLEARQRLYIDPQLESVILNNIKEQRVILEKLVVLQAELNKDQSSALFDELKTYTQVVLSIVYHAYRLTHGGADSKMMEFELNLTNLLPKALKSYEETKKQLEQ